MNDVGRGRRSPLPQLVLDVPLVEDVPLGVLHQEHDYGSAATTAVRPLSTLTPKVFDKPNKMFDFFFFFFIGPFCVICLYLVVKL